MTTRLLFQFPLSHYCEKTRWHLDAKGLDYRSVNLLPGPHPLVTRPLTGTQTLPILRDGHQNVADSTGIAFYLESEYPEPPLLPRTPATRQHALALEDYFDEKGDHVRRWIYSQLIDSPHLHEMMYREYALPLRVFGRATLPALRLGLRRLYRLSPIRVAESQEKMREGLDRLEAELQHDPSRHLVGDTLTLADITAASMYAPLVMPDNSPWNFGFALPPALQAMRDEVRARTAGQWILRLYAEAR